VSDTVRTSRPALRLLGYARPYAWLVVLTILFSLLYGGGLTGRALIVRILVDDVAIPYEKAESLEDLIALAKKPKIDAEVLSEKLSEKRHISKERARHNLARAAIAATILVLVMVVIRMVRDYASEWVMTRLLVDMQRDLTNKLLRLPLGEHQRGARGDAISRMTSDTNVANRFQTMIFGDVLEDTGVVIASLVALFYLSWQLTLSLLVIGPPVVLVLSVFGTRIRKASRRRQEQVGEVMQRFVQILSGIKVIKAFGAEEMEDRAFGDEVMRYFRRALRVVRNRVYSRGLVELVSQSVMYAVLFLGFWAAVGELWGLTLGSTVAFSFIAASLYRPMKSLTQISNTVNDTVPSAERLFEVLDAAPEDLDAPGTRSLERIEHGIRFQDVVFNYGREEVLRGVDLEIPAGKTLALVGPTGSGKTTIADLLLRFYDPERGSIEFDGLDGRKISRRSLREMSAVVSQEAFLFDTSILENIRFGRPEASHDEVVAAARAANAHEFVEKLPQGYETRVGELGNQLSGGQRQRLTVARAILRDPQILILDEPTSALDAISEQLVQEAIANLMKGRTVLVIAHRLSTVQSADRIAVLENGAISMTGTHDELSRRGGLYQELVRLQLAPSS
jgi:subfamily B ATP-binding cassette protein MsbA